MPSPLNEALFNSLGLGELVPPSLAAWRPLVFAGVRFFLQRLSAERQAELVLDQFALPGDATAAERLVKVLRRCPTLHKLGQVIARHRGLNAELRTRLQTLESLPPATPVALLRERIRRQLPADAPVELAAEALAEGSVAVVVPFTFDDGNARQHGVFKVLKPDAAARMEEELAIWLELGQFLEERARALGLPALEFHDTLESVRVLLAKEVRLEVEQANLAAAAPFYRHDARIVIPRLLPWCTPQMTAMARVFGAPVTTAPLDAAARRRLAATLTSGLLAQPFWTKDDWAVFHADPHAGNLFATDNGRLAVLDWSLTARLSKAQREAMVDAALGGLLLDEKKIRTAVAALGTLAEDNATLSEAAARAVQRLRAGTLPGMSWLIALLDDVAQRTDAGFRDDLVLFRKAWFTLDTVIDDVLGGAATAAPNPDDALIGVALQRFFAELPARLAAPFGSRRFDSHVSNADLVELWLSLGLVPARYWWGRDALG